MSFGEILVILLIAVLIFGPDKIPEIARGLGQGVRAMKDATDSIKKEVMSHVDTDDSFKEIEEEIKDTKKTMDDSIKEANKNVNDFFDDTFDGPIKRT